MELYDVAFVSIVKDYPAVISKSQTPGARKEKAESLLDIQARYRATFGKDITEGQIMKKIHNMKSRIKNKTDIKRTGNVKIILKPWEEMFLKFMDGDDCNPTIHRIPGACVIGAQSSSTSASIRPETVSEHLANPPLNPLFEPCTIVDVDIEGTPEIVIPEYAPIMGQQRFPKRRRLSLETEEMQNLTNSELQRLVLLTQLDVLNRKQEKLIRESENSVK